MVRCVTRLSFPGHYFYFHSWWYFAIPRGWQHWPWRFQRTRCCPWTVCVCFQLPPEGSLRWCALWQHPSHQPEWSLALGPLASDVPTALKESGRTASMVSTKAIRFCIQMQYLVSILASQKNLLSRGDWATENWSCHTCRVKHSQLELLTVWEFFHEIPRCLFSQCLCTRTKFIPHVIPSKTSCASRSRDAQCEHLYHDVIPRGLVNTTTLKSAPGVSRVQLRHGLCRGSDRNYIFSWKRPIVDVYEIGFSEFIVSLPYSEHMWFQT